MKEGPAGQGPKTCGSFLFRSQSAPARTGRQYLTDQAESPAGKAVGPVAASLEGCTRRRDSGERQAGEARAESPPGENSHFRPAASAETESFPEPSTLQRECPGSKARGAPAGQLR